MHQSNTEPQGPEHRIVKFIKKHHVLTLATCAENIPWCASCFYVFDEDHTTFIFTSEKDTRHIKEMENNKVIAGTIALETKITGKIRGIQFSGTVTELKNTDYKAARKKYIKRFPVAAFTKTPLWRINLNFIKMTDNRLGFGKKLIWNT
jgi:hypothetical protein